MVNIVIDMIQETFNGTLIFYGPREFQISVLRQSIPISGQSPFTASALIPLMEQSLDEQFFPVTCKYA